MRLRKNIECLTENELHDLREAFAGLYLLPESNPKSFARIAGLHGLPSPSYCNHLGTAGFLSWHRAYLLEIENALRDIRCNVTLPYWDWNATAQNGIPEPCKNPTHVNRSGATVDNPLFRGPIPASAGGGFTTRRSDINTVSFADIANSAQVNQSNPTFNSYAGSLNGDHGSVHIRFGGSMSGVDFAAFDPIFFFHHANVDRLWANWQATVGAATPSSELNAVLQPFTRQFTNTWHTGADFQNIADWDYNYRNWCFVIPPFVWPDQLVLRIPVGPWLFDSKKINLILRSDSMAMQSVELRVFVNDEEANEESELIENPNFAGSIGIFGMGKAHGKSIHGMRPEMHKLNITKSVNRNVKKRSKEFTLKFVSAQGGKKFDLKKSERYEITIEAI